MKNVIPSVSWSDGIKEDGNNNTDHVLFSNKMDTSSLSEVPFCTPLLIEKLLLSEVCVSLYLQIKISSV